MQNLEKDFRYSAGCSNYSHNMEKITLALFIISGFLAYFLILSQRQKNEIELENSLMEAGDLVRERKQKSLKKIIDLFEKTDQIKNNDVEDLLDVSDATATNYLDELQRQGRIIQHGESGRGVYYTKR